tara:strand:- start:9976 stop:10566 length:591 start_codon:yes stop_codon:yes gene_type:complete
MKIFKYNDYDTYIKQQKETTDFKYNKIVYVRSAVIKEIVGYASNEVKNVLCHGTRSGEEQRMFSEILPDAEIIGTEICDKAQYAPMTKVWDFNKPKEEWLGKFDIVYSNSLDHSIDPKSTLEVWGNQVSDKGFLAIEWSDYQNMKGVTIQDPLNATGNEIKELVESFGGLVFSDKIAEGEGLSRHAGYVMIFRKGL